MDILVLLVFFLFGLVFISSFRKKLPREHLYYLRLLYFYHIFFGLYNYFFIGSDPIRYWALAKEISPEKFLYYLTEKSGTFFMLAAHYYPSNVMGLSYFTGTMVYTVFGFIAIALFYNIAYDLIPKNSYYRGYKLFPLLFFLPNLHFWSCTAGKDTLSFLSVSLFFYGLMKPFYRFPLIALALILSYAVRPHISLFLALGFGLSVIVDSKSSKFRKIFMGFIFLGVGIVLLPKVMEYARIEESSFEAFDKFSSNKASLLSRSTTGSRIDISSYPLPLKLFTFLYRPLFFDINGIPALLASIENIFLLILSWRMFKNNFFKTFMNAPSVIKGMFFFLIVGTFAFSQSLGNLGIIIRMRNMFLPGLLIFMLWSFSYQQVLQHKGNKISS